MYAKTLKSLLLLLPLLGGCSSFELPDITSSLNPYRIDVRQGNFLTQEMTAKLRAGQSREQVRFILGSPLIEDAFHRDRWDYVYRYKSGEGYLVERQFAVHFVDDKLVRVSGDVAADTPDAAATDASDAAKRAKVIEIGGAQAPAAAEAAGDKSAK